MRAVNALNLFRIDRYVENATYLVRGCSFWGFYSKNARILLAYVKTLGS